MDANERREIIGGLAVMLSVPTLLVMFAWWAWTRPETYKTAVSPDRGWSVRVFRQRDLLGVPVTVEARDSHGKRLVRVTIDSRDMWNDVEQRYFDVRCTNDSILVGPGWWDGRKRAYFWIHRADLSYAGGDLH